MSKISTAFDEHLKTIQATRTLENSISGIASVMANALRKSRTLFWAGNGGSASDAQHLAAELVGRFEKDRPAIASIALTTDTSILTAVGNDYGFESVFSRQIEALGRQGDVLVAISTSGNSPNIVKAVQAAKERGVMTIGLLGKTGGKLKELVEYSLVVPSDNTARIQEAHILIEPHPLPTHRRIHFWLVLLIFQMEIESATKLFRSERSCWP